MNLYTTYDGENKGFDYTVSTAPTGELVTFADVEDRMNLADDEDAGFIADQIKAVRAYLEKALNMTLVSSKTITAYWQQYAGRLPLPFPPVTSVTSVTTVSSSGDETLLTVNDDYWIEGVRDKIIHFSKVQNAYGVKVVYVTGLSEDGIVDMVKDAILSEVMEWYHGRGNETDDQYVIGRIAEAKLRTLKWSH